MLKTSIICIIAVCRVIISYLWNDLFYGFMQFHIFIYQL